MKEEYCQTCGNRIRFPESARKVVCDSCDSEWIVVRTGNMVNLAPVGTLQTSGGDGTLQMRLKELQRQAMIKEDHVRQLREEIEGIVVEFRPVPIAAKLGAVVVALFFVAGAAGAWFFKQQLFVPVLGALAVAPFVGVVLYGRQINAREREKLAHKKALIQELASLKKEIGGIEAEKKQARADAVVEE